MLKLGKNADGLFTFGNPNELGKILKTSGTTLQAHHLIPWALKDNPVVQKAAEAGFHLNDELNGLLLKSYSKELGNGVHGNHPAYSEYVRKKIFQFGQTKFTPETAKNYLENNLIPELRHYILMAEKSGMNLNDFFKLPQFVK